MSKAYTTSGRECGTFEIINKSEPGQRCIIYTNYQSNNK